MAGHPEECQALQGVKVLDLAEGPAALCGKVLADLGATCVKVERPGGEPGRWVQDYVLVDEKGGSNSAFDYWNAGKEGIVLDLTSAHGQECLREFIRTCDIMVDSFDAGTKEILGLTYGQLLLLHPSLISVSVTPFGLSGPYSSYKANDLVCQAMGGLMNLYGEENRPPLAAPCDQGFQVAALAAAGGALAALRYRNLTGRGEEVEVAAHEVLASTWYQLVNYSGNSTILRRSGGRRPYGGAAPMGIYPASDGFIHIMVMSPKHWTALLEWMGNPETFQDPVWQNRHFRAQNYDVIDPIVSDFFRRFPKKHLLWEGQRRGLVISPVNTLDDFVQDEHVKSRDFLLPDPVGADGERACPGAPFVLSATPLMSGKRPPPLLEGVGRLSWNDAGAAPTLSSGPKAAGLPGGRESAAGMPLQDIRVIDLTMAVAGPTMSRLFAELGAEVIRIESEAHPQRGRQSRMMGQAVLRQQLFTYADVNRNKRSFSLNLGQPEGRDLLNKLVATSDVVATSISPAVLERWGLTYEQLRRWRPDLVVVSLSGFGLMGPYRNFRSAAVTSAAMSGLYHMWSYADAEKPVGSPVWHPDLAMAMHGLIGTMAALSHREQTGRGQLVDVAQIESTATLLGPLLLERVRSGWRARPLGNSSPYYAPFGCYPCQGEDRWCVIAVRTNEEWQGLCRAVEDDRLASDSRFASQESRLAHRPEIDQILEAWTRQLTPFQVMRLLQKEGVPAGVVQNGEDLFHDVHLRARGFLVPLDQPGLGAIEYPGAMIRLSETPMQMGRCAEEGEDNEFVLGQLFGLAPEETRRLADEKVTA